jgi:hypothetical protein
LALGSADQQTGTTTKSEDLAAVRLQLADLSGNDSITSEIGSLGWDEVAEDGINEGSSRRQKSGTQEQFDESSTRC